MDISAQAAPGTHLHTCIVILINEQWLDDHQNLVHIGAHEVVQLEHDTVDDLDQQVALLVLQGGLHLAGQAARQAAKSQWAVSGRANRKAGSQESVGCIYQVGPGCKAME